jgi:hypothetical protein
VNKGTLISFCLRASEIYGPALLVAVLAVAGTQGKYAVMRLRRRFANASTDDLVKMDQIRQARQGWDQGIARPPVIGEGYSYEEIIGG